MAASRVIVQLEEVSGARRRGSGGQQANCGEASVLWAT
jgi:hypothetical protein